MRCTSSQVFVNQELFVELIQLVEKVRAVLYACQCRRWRGSTQAHGTTCWKNCQNINEQEAQKVMSMRQCYKMQVLNILTGVHQKYGKGPINVNVILATEHLLWPEN